MTGTVPAAGIPRPHYPWDQSERGMPLPWYYFEQALELAIRQDLAAQVLNVSRDNILVNTVATDAYLCLCDLAEGSWINFHRYAPL